MFDDRSLSRIVDAANEGLFVVDPGHSLVYLNETVVALVGERREELLGRDLSVLSEGGVVSTATVRELRSAVDRIVDGDVRSLSIERSTARDGRGTGTVFDLRSLAGEERRTHVVVSVRDVGGRVAAEERLDAQSRRIERLHEGSTAMIACRSESEVYDLAVEVAEDVLAFELCSVLVVEDEWLVPRAWSTATKPAGVRTMRTDEGLAGRTYTSGEPRLVPVVERDPDADPASESYRSGVSVPVGDIGVFQAVATETHAFDGRDVKLVELLMSAVAEAVARIRAERRLAAERDRLAALFENVPEPAVSYEVEEGKATVSAVNPAFDRVFGFDPSATTVGELNTRFVPEGEEETAETLDERIVAGERFTAEVTRLAVDGGREFLVHVVPTVDDGETTAGFVIYTDITERKHHERRLDDLHGVTRDLMAAETDAAVADLALRAAREVLGLELAAIYLYDDDRGVLEPVAATTAATEAFSPLPEFGPGSGLAWRAFETGEPFVTPDIREHDGLYNSETEIRTELIFPFGGYGIGIAGSTEIGAFSESTVSLAGVLAANVEAALERADREATLRERERDLARQNERLSEFAGVVSHDLRNPLTVARGYLAMLDGDDELLSRIDDAHRRMDALTDDLLSLAREGKVVGETEPVALADAARRAWSIVETADATLAIETDSTIEADPDRLVELFANLYRNAVEHGGTGVTVTVSDGEDGFVVADDGPGIPPDERAAALDAGYTTGEDGTGLGLAIVNRIAEAHGWSVSLGESESGGTRIAFAVE
jgi:PAS domain S-box-containing protein